VAVYETGGKWIDCGRLADSFEINGLTVYNGKLYAGSIPCAEVYRYEGSKEWTLLKRFFAPKDGNLLRYEVPVLCPTAERE